MKLTRERKKKRRLGREKKKMSERAFTSPILSWQIQGHFALRISRSNPEKKEKIFKGCYRSSFAQTRMLLRHKGAGCQSSRDPAPSANAEPITFKSRSPVALRSGAKPFSDVRISSGRGVGLVEIEGNKLGPRAKSSEYVLCVEAASWERASLLAYFYTTT